MNIINKRPSSKTIYIYMVVACFLLVSLCYSTPTTEITSLQIEANQDQSQTLPSESNSKGLTNVHPPKHSKYNCFVTPDNNKIWAGALSLAWNQLKHNIIKEDIKLDTQNQTVLNMIQNFNKEAFTTNDLNESSYYVNSGYGQQALQTINREMALKFPNKTIADLDIHLNDEDIISYSYIHKAFQFETAFQKLQQFKFKNQQVEGFYQMSYQQKNQLYYYFYENKDQFLFGIDSKNQDQEILFLKTKKNYSIQDLTFIIDRFNGSDKNRLSNQDQFAMPVIKFDLRRSVHELEGLNFLNPSFDSYTLVKVLEAVKLNIDEKGVKVQNLAQMVMARGIPKASKKFILDDTFWVLLRQKDQNPYLIMQVNSPVQTIRLD